jgi:hypothetical protein
VTYLIVAESKHLVIIGKDCGTEALGELISQVYIVFDGFIIIQMAGKGWDKDH